MKVKVIDIHEEDAYYLDEDLIGLTIYFEEDDFCVIDGYVSGTFAYNETDVKYHLVNAIKIEEI